MAPSNVVQSINLSYPTFAPILTYSKLEDRKRIAKWIPALRFTQRTAPFIFETVLLSSEDKINYHIQFDGVIWRFKTENNQRRTEGSKMNLVNEKGLILKPNLTYSDIINIVRYFLKGRTLRVNNFRSDGCYQFWPCFHTIPIIGNLRISQLHYSKNCLESFWNTKVGSLELHQYPDENMTDQLSKIKCDDVKIYVRPKQFDVSYVSLPFKKLQVYESYLNIGRFCDSVEKYREGRHEEGCSYTGIYTENADEVWASLKYQFPLKVEHKNFLVIGTDKPGRDLLVERWEEPVYKCYGHSVKVVENINEEQKRAEHSYPMETFKKYQKVLEFCFSERLLFLMMIVFFFLTLSSLISLPFCPATFYFIDIPINALQLFSAFFRFALFLISIPYFYTANSQSYIQSYYSVKSEVHVTSSRFIRFVHFLIFVKIFADIPINHIYYLTILDQPVCIGEPFYYITQTYIVLSKVKNFMIPLFSTYLPLTSVIIIILSYLMKKNSMTLFEMLRSVPHLIQKHFL